MVPVLDLRRAIGIAGDDVPMDIIVVVIHDGHIFGLLASDVRGVVELDDRFTPPTAPASPRTSSSGPRTAAW